jgi:UDP-N-acetylglucosamine--N-acetylmuramyl-(pentapeptide) pyrophosphoryl-undecaprenol N-acetylglucosamine transferase
MEREMSARHFVLAAGGTGGHMIPAHALAAELIRRGHHVALVTDERGAKIPGLFDGAQTHIIPAGRITKNPLSWWAGYKAIMAGRAMTLRLFETFQPSAVIGFGGYPAFPALLAARKAGIRSAVHEQNAVLGRVNRMVAGWVDAIAVSYPQISRLAEKHAGKTWLVGNPVRAEVVGLREQPFPLLDEDGVFRILVVGGSQGATILSDVVPDGLAMLPVNLRRRLQVTQQCRAEDIEAVRQRYKDLGIAADLATYLNDLPDRLGWSHLVIARAGASTIAELACAGRPAILIPLPSATDDHQTANVREIVGVGGARSIPQSRFTAKELAKQMQRLGLDPDGLTNAAGRARSVGRPNATRDLADLVENLDHPVAPQTVGVAQDFRLAGASA